MSSHMFWHKRCKCILESELLFLNATFANRSTVTKKYKKEVALENPLSKNIKKPLLQINIQCRWYFVLEEMFSEMPLNFETYLLQCVKENRLCKPAEKSSLTGLMSVYVKSIWMNLVGGRGREWRHIMRNQQPTGREHRQEDKYTGNPSLQWKQICKCKQGSHYNTLQLLQTKFSKTWNFSLSKMPIEQIRNNLVRLNISKYVHCTHLGKVTFLWSLLWKYFHEQCLIGKEIFAQLHPN